MWLGFFRRLKYGKPYKDIGSFDARPMKYSNDHMFEPLQSIHLGKYESRTRECLKRILCLMLVLAGVFILAWIVFQSIQALSIF